MATVPISGRQGLGDVAGKTHYNSPGKRTVHRDPALGHPLALPFLHRATCMRSSLLLPQFGIFDLPPLLCRFTILTSQPGHL